MSSIRFSKAIGRSRAEPRFAMRYSMLPTPLAYPPISLPHMAAAPVTEFNALHNAWPRVRTR